MAKKDQKTFSIEGHDGFLVTHMKGDPTDNKLFFKVSMPIFVYTSIDLHYANDAISMKWLMDNAVETVVLQMETQIENYRKAQLTND